MAKILVVDDEKDVVELLKFLLEKDGHQISTAYNGREALESVAKAKPDLILLDWSLPVLDGLAVTRKLHERTDSGHIPVIFLSAHAAPSSQKTARSMRSSR